MDGHARGAMARSNERQELHDHRGVDGDRRAGILTTMERHA